MNSVFVSVELPVPAAKVWERIGDPSAIAGWHPAIAESPVDGQTRTCVLRDGAVLRERIDEVNAEARTMRYAITESPLPIRDYTSTIAVREVEPRRTVVEWSSTFAVTAGPEAAMVEAIRSVYATGLEALRDRAA